MVIGLIRTDLSSYRVVCLKVVDRFRPVACLSGAPELCRAKNKARASASSRAECQKRLGGVPQWTQV